MSTEAPQRAGEIIATSTTDFTAQCYELYQLPPLGSPVKNGDAELEIYAIVYNATTSSIEPGRHPIARGKDETSEEAIYHSNPQLEKLLRSEFSALVVGHKAGDKVHHYLPPKPARIHSFVHLCSPQEIRDFSQSLGFLDIIINSQLPIPRDELIAACLRQISRAYEDADSFLVLVGKRLAALLSDNFSQLSAILERIKQ
ncbi:MAG TPA: hypothetical protein G4O19_00860 [Dehalococcoidia bacterium]|nr:hypothetical protein [Dehalococcoidia bacterium]